MPYSSLTISTTWAITSTGVGIPCLGYLLRPGVSLLPSLGYYPALGFLFYPIFLGLFSYFIFSRLALALIKPFPWLALGFLLFVKWLLPLNGLELVR